MELFGKVQPSGATPLGGTLKRVITPYIDRLDDAEKIGGREAVEKIKPINYIVITDGAPSESLCFTFTCISPFSITADDTTEDVIINAARRLDEKSRPKAQLGIQFVQIGNSSDASEFLERLDDDLVKKYKIRVSCHSQVLVPCYSCSKQDMVDTTKAKWRKNLDAETLIKTLTGSFNRRVDEQGGKVFRKDMGSK